MTGLALALLTIITLPSAEVHFGGTFIAAAICDDGIIVASDSRSTFIDEAGRPLGYIDGMPKIYVGRGPAVAVSGLSSLGDELLTSFVRRNAFLLDRAADEVLFGFAVNLPFKNTNSVAMLSAGFLKGKPTVCGRTPFEPLRCTQAGFFSNKNPAILRDSLVSLGRLPKPQEAVAILKQAIKEISAADITVGGPPAILHLRDGKPPIWLEGEPADNGWTKICDLVSAHRQGRAVIRPTGSAQELALRLDAICPR